MKKPLVSRIFILAVVYFAVFCILAILQFSNMGIFTYTAGLMTIRGRYLKDSPQSGISAETSAGISAEETGIQIADGATVFFGGLEFILKEERGKGLTLTDIDGSAFVNPDHLFITDNTVRFVLPGGTALVFSSYDSAAGPELHINAEFAETASGVAIPVTLRRSSIFRGNGQPAIMYGGSRYVFSGQGQELENGIVTLSGEAPHISYRSRGSQRVFDPADYIIANVQNYESALSNWRDLSYARWNQNAAALQSEDDIIAFCSEALARGNYPAAIASIPAGFRDSARHSFRSAGFTGGMSNAYRTFIAEENEKINLITRLAREGSPEILKEKNLLDYLFSRNNTALAGTVMEIIQNTSPETLLIDYCPGLFEAAADIKRWQPGADNSAEHLTEQMILLISENLNLDADGNLVFAYNSEGKNLEFSLRLGKALIPWAQENQNADWEAIGKSLVLSAITDAGAGAGNLYNILNPADYYPRAASLSSDQWAWTVSPSLRISYPNGNIGITASFPAGTSHHVIIRGVRPFIKLQIHGMDWRSDSQFEIYDSSGWVYYPQDQILILKLRHRAATENVTIVYREEPPPVIQEPEEPDPWINPWEYNY